MKYPKKGAESKPQSLDECWKKMDKMQKKIERFEKNSNSQTTGEGSAVYTELLVRYNNLLSTLGDVAKGSNNLDQHFVSQDTQ